MVVAAEENRWCWNEMVALAVSWKQFINLVYVQYTLLLLPTYMSVLILVWILVDSDSLMVSWKQFINLAPTRWCWFWQRCHPQWLKFPTPIISILTWRVAPATYMLVSLFSFSLKHFHTFWRLWSLPCCRQMYLEKSLSTDHGFMCADMVDYWFQDIINVDDILKSTKHTVGQSWQRILKLIFKIRNQSTDTGDTIRLYVKEQPSTVSQKSTKWWQFCSLCV